MEEFIRKLFSEYGFTDPISNERFLFFQKSDDTQVEYYLVELVEATRLESYLETEKTESILSFFNELKKTSEDVEKNTTLLVFAKLDELNNESYDTLKRDIWRIEEDEYFFNKSVILYEENTFDHFNFDDSLMNQIEKKVSNEELFTEFAKNYFNDLVYLLCIQLYIKIPFLEIPIKEEKFIDLQSQIDNELTDSQLSLKDKLTEELLYDLSELRDDFLDTSNESIDQFLNKFIQQDETD